MMFSSLKRLFKSSRGSISAEFAISITVIITLLMGGVEFGRYVLVRQKLDRATVTAGDLVARSETMNVDKMNQIFASSKQVMTPYAFGSEGIVIVSMVFSPDGSNPEVVWQLSGGGTKSASSQVGIAGGSATLPTGFLLRAGESVIIAEVFYDYKPMILGTVIEDHEVRHVAFFRPRLGGSIPLE